ncbi:hypothetical protein Ocin01_19996, partial [Orchesella cincta]
EVKSYVSSSAQMLLVSLRQQPGVSEDLALPSGSCLRKSLKIFKTDLRFPERQAVYASEECSRGVSLLGRTL